jgi:hypothetical protein
LRGCTAALLATLFAVPAFAAPVTGTAALSCGGAGLTARTVRDAHMKPDDAFGYLSQIILLRPAANSPEISLHAAPAQLMRLPGGQSVLSVIVQSWACLRAKTGARYVLLDVACQRDDSGGACGGQAERFALFSVTGVQLDVGNSPQTPRATALYARLGVTADGVQMQDATGP